MGYFAGLIAGLRLKHIIDETKSNITYLTKQQYGTSSSYIKAFNQVFSDNRIRTMNISNVTIAKRLYTLLRIYHKQLGTQDFKLKIASNMGELYGSIIASNNSKPIILKLYEKLIGV